VQLPFDARGSPVESESRRSVSALHAAIDVRCRTSDLRTTAAWRDASKPLAVRCPHRVWMVRWQTCG